MREPEYRDLLVEICHRMYRQGYIAAGDGNVSCKIDDERILVTPTGFHKGFIKRDDLTIVDLGGKLLRGTNKPSSEFLMHQVAYRERPDIRAVVHGHPPMIASAATSSAATAATAATGIAASAASTGKAYSATAWIAAGITAASGSAATTTVATTVSAAIAPSTAGALIIHGWRVQRLQSRRKLVAR